jgi:uncharacterized membrane protein
VLVSAYSAAARFLSTFQLTPFVSSVSWLSLSLASSKLAVFGPNNRTAELAVLDQDPTLRNQVVQGLQPAMSVFIVEGPLNSL